MKRLEILKLSSIIVDGINNAKQSYKSTKIQNYENFLMLAYFPPYRISKIYEEEVERKEKKFTSAVKYYSEDSSIIPFNL